MPLCYGNTVTTTVVIGLNLINSVSSDSMAECSASFLLKSSSNGYVCFVGIRDKEGVQMPQSIITARCMVTVNYSPNHTATIHLNR